MRCREAQRLAFRAERGPASVAFPFSETRNDVAAAGKVKGGLRKTSRRALQLVRQRPVGERLGEVQARHPLGAVEVGERARDP